jgi:hypothetical protein
MNRWIVRLPVMVALCATTASAQGIGLGVGTLIPQGELADGAKSGLAAAASLEFGRKIALRAEVIWTNSDLDGIIITDPGDPPIPGSAELSGDVKLIGGAASLVFHLTDGAIRPYIFGGAGYYNRSVAQTASDAGTEISNLSRKESQLGFHGGVGLKFQLGPLGLFGEARYVTIDTDEMKTNFAPLLIGIRL